MVAPIIIPDNCSREYSDITQEQWLDLSFISDKSIEDLCDGENSSLLIFPHHLGDRGDLLPDSFILHINENKISAANVMGFIGRNGTMVKIRSRFDNDSDDYFMHYMLEKVFSIHLFDLPYRTDSEAVFDFSVFLFPYFIKKAISQGIFKEYVTCRNNDEHLRGVVDIPRHIRSNYPYMGKIAYNNRVHAADNPITELVRHTIEYIREKEYGDNVLGQDEETKACVSQIISVTASYVKAERNRVIRQNLRSKIHPYYSEYEPLRRLCIQILNQEGLKYGEKDDRIYGILFDGAWLWEAYLATILNPVGFVHPENRISSGGIPLFESHGENGESDRLSRMLYPDFYKENVILDAKYKHLNRGVGKEDLYQVVTYMYCTRAKEGNYVYPYEKQMGPSKYRLNGYGGTITVIPFPIPQNCEKWEIFETEIRKNENAFKKLWMV